MSSHTKRLWIINRNGKNDLENTFGNKFVAEFVFNIENSHPLIKN